MPTVCGTSKCKDKNVTWTLNPKYPKQKVDEQCRIVSNKKRNQKRTTASNFSENNIRSSGTKKKKVKKLLKNGTPMKTPLCDVQTTQDIAKKVIQNIKKATSAGSSNVNCLSPQRVEDARFLLSSLVEPEENNDDNDNDVNKEIGGSLWTNLVEKISYPKFVYDSKNDKVMKNRHGIEGDQNIFRPIRHELNEESLWNKNTDTRNRIYESTLAKKLPHSKSKTRPKTRGRNTNDLKKKCVATSLACTKVKKLTCSKTHIAPELLAYSSDKYDDYTLDTNLTKNTSKKGRQSGTIKNHIDHKVICVYRTEIESGAKKPCYDGQVTYMHYSNDEKGNNDNRCNTYSNRENICNINMEYDDAKSDISEEYLDSSSENATAIYKNTDEDAITVGYGDYLDYISRTPSSSAIKIEIKQFMETCDLVFDKFSDILFDTVTSDYNANSEMNPSITTLKPMNE